MTLAPWNIHHIALLAGTLLLTAVAAWLEGSTRTSYAPDTRLATSAAFATAIAHYSWAEPNLGAALGVTVAMAGTILGAAGAIAEIVARRRNRHALFDPTRLERSLA